MLREIALVGVALFSVAAAAQNAAGGITAAGMARHGFVAPAARLGSALGELP